MSDYCVGLLLLVTDPLKELSLEGPPCLEWQVVDLKQRLLLGRVRIQHVDSVAKRASYSKFEYSNFESKVALVKRTHLAALLRQVRIDAQLTQAQLASKLDQTQSYVSKYESGEQ